MADALVSPAVGGAMWAASGAAIAVSARQVTQSRRDDLVPLMGVMGAFVFAAQMINFAIPGTGSSGHLGGGLLLALLLGPWAAVLVMASVLVVQAFFFADGGLLALGCNIFNLGVLPAFVAAPLVHRALAGDRPGSLRDRASILAAAVVALQTGALGVVFETRASGLSSLPLRPFCAVMLPIHAVIGVFEGLATVAALAFLAQARPGALTMRPASPRLAGNRRILAGVALATVILGVLVSRYASTLPDGLEWSLARTAPDLAAPAGKATPVIEGGTPSAGLVGGLLVLAVAGLVGLVARAGGRRARASRAGGRDA